MSFAGELTLGYPRVIRLLGLTFLLTLTACEEPQAATIPGTAITSTSHDTPSTAATNESADGVVSRGDYIKAVLETVACLEKRGLSAGAAPDDFGSYSISVTPPPGYGEAEANAAYDACYAAELAAVEALYLDSIRPIEVEYQASVTSCLAHLGLVEANAAWDKVRQAVRENFSTPGVEECWIDPYRFEE